MAVPPVRQRNSPVNPDPNGRESEQSDDHARKIAVLDRRVKANTINAFGFKYRKFP